MLELKCKKCKALFLIDCQDDIEDRKYTVDRLDRLINFQQDTSTLHCPICGGPAKEIE